MQLDRFHPEGPGGHRRRPGDRPAAQSPILDAEHLLSALVEPDDGIPAETLRRLGVDLPAFRGELAASWPSAPASRAARCRSTRAQGVDRACRGRGPPPRRRVRLDRAPPARRVAEAGGEAQALLERHAAGQGGHPPGAPERPRRPARHLAEPRGHVRGPREVRPRPHRRGARRQARSRSSAGTRRSAASSRS